MSRPARQIPFAAVVLLPVLCLALAGCTGGLLWEIADTRYPVATDLAAPGSGAVDAAPSSTEGAGTPVATRAPYAWVYPLVPLGYAVDLLVWPVILLLQ